jgi:hypothetical protein
MRVYIPATVDDLALQTSGQWEPELAFAVTEEWRDAADDLDEDELAEAAIDAAAMESGLEFGSRLRAVIAADVSRADAVVDPKVHPAAVRINGKLSPASVACVFLDEDDAADDVTAARAGDEAALERLADRTLLWYDLAEVLGN